MAAEEREAERAGGGGPKSDCLPQMPLSQAGFPGWPVFNGLSETRQK